MTSVLKRARSSARRRSRRLLYKMPAAVREPVLTPLVTRQRAGDVTTILRAGAFDREWYEAQTAVSFASDEAACLDYLRFGRRAGRSPHPLFEPRMAQPTRWRRGAVDPLLDNLRGKIANQSSVHLALPPDWVTHTAEGVPRWLDFVRGADESTLMPQLDEQNTQVATTWGDFRRRALDVARAARAHRAFTSAPRLSSTAPPVAPELARVELPTTDGTPLVSIVLPTWNRGALIRRAVESVQAQSFQDWELIVVDDGSDDDTLLVLEGLRRLDPRIVVIAESHGGVCRARNAAIGAARGTYVTFLDSDNSWNPDFLERAVGFLVTERTPWAHAAMQLERDGGTFYRALEGSREHLLLGNYIDLNVLIVERAALTSIGGFDESLRRAVDYDLVLRLSELAPPRLIPTIGTVYADRLDDVPRISNTEPVGWNQVVQLKHLLAADAAPDRPTVAGRVSIVVPARSIIADLVALVDPLLDEPGDVEVVLVCSGSDDSFVRMVELLALSRPSLIVVPFVTRALESAALMDLGARRASGEYLVAWNSDHFPSQGWTAPLKAALARPDVAVAQPIVFGPDGTVDSAGAVFVGHDPNPAPLLGGFPVEDAADLGTAVIPAALSGVVMLRTADFRRLGGFDAIYRNALGEVDLSLRAYATGVGSTVVVPSAHVRRYKRDRGFAHDIAGSVTILRTRHTVEPGSDTLWTKVGFEQTGRRVLPLLDASGKHSAVRGAFPVVRPRVERVTEGRPRLRWSLDTAAPAGPRGRSWGDTHFAEALAVSLRGLGQHVHVDRRDARDGAYRDFDDVTLVVRGLDLVVPRPGGVSLQWIISHPDLVSAAECAVYDHVFAASIPWSADVSRRWGITIDPLLQCTDARLFRPDAAEPDTGVDLVFVGNSRNAYRNSLKYAVESGLEPAVYGSGWARFVPLELVRGEYFPNEELPALYASVGAVLNDHWDDMRHDGFISNRVFDVLAAGGRLVSDEVAGLDTLFGPAVQVFRSQSDVARLFSGDWRARFPDREARLRTAELVRTRHTFDQRASTLLDAALRVQAHRHLTGAR
jgi:GT2 family glycosyltransferase